MLSDNNVFTGTNEFDGTTNFDGATDFDGTNTFDGATVLNGALSGTSIKDEDTMTSNSDTAVPTQQSVKAYTDATFAPIAKGVTNGDSHDHSGGDGAQINHTTLSNIGTNTHSQIDTHIANTSNPHSVTASQVGLGNVTNNAQYYAGGTDVAVTDGGTGSSTAAGARTNLGITLPQITINTSQFDTTSATLADITGLTANVTSGVTYVFEANLHVTPDATDGHKYAISGTATATTIIFQVLSVSNTTNLFVITSSKSAMNDGAGQAGATSAFTKITGTFIAGSTGTLTVQFAKNGAGLNTSSVLIGSSFVVTQIS